MRQKMFESCDCTDDNKRVIEYFLSLSAGHPRTLALLKAELTYLATTGVACVLRRWQSSYKESQPEAVHDKVIEHILAKTVYKQEVSLDEWIILEGVNPIRVKELIRRAVIINPIDPSRAITFVPQLSLLFLRHWSSKIVGSAKTIGNRLKSLVFRLLQLGENLNPTAFEEFHLLFEQLRCWTWHKLFPQRKYETLATWFRGGVFVRSLEKTKQSTCQVIPQDPFSADEHAASQVEIKNLREATGPIKRSFLARAGQPGLDILTPMGNKLVCFEARYSEPAESTASKLSASKDVKKKSVLFSKEVNASKMTLSGEKINVAKCVFVLVAHRDKLSPHIDFSDTCNKSTGDKDIQQQYDAQSFPIIVFDRETLLDRYGPTFRKLCGFMLSYSHRHYQTAAARTKGDVTLASVSASAAATSSTTFETDTLT